MPAEVVLLPGEVQRRQGEKAPPADGLDIERDIGFGVTYRGIPADSGASVYTIGKSVVRAAVNLVTYTAVSATSGKRIDRKAAIAAWRDRAVEGGATADELKWYDNSENPTLCYVWSVIADENHRGDEPYRVAPTWAMGTDRPLVVDALTGKTSYND